MTNVQKVRDAYETKADAQEWLIALKELLQQYQQRQTHVGCPLCMVEQECDACPWYVFTDAGCDAYRNEHFEGTTTYNYTGRGSSIDKAYRQVRMRQLPKWIFSYEQALKDWR